MPLVLDIEPELGPIREWGNYVRTGRDLRLMVPLLGGWELPYQALVVCQVPPALIIAFCSSKRKFSDFILHLMKQSLRKLHDLPIVTQLVSSRATVWTYIGLIPEPILWRSGVKRKWPFSNIYLLSAGMSGPASLPRFCCSKSGKIPASFTSTCRNSLCLLRY